MPKVFRKYPDIHVNFTVFGVMAYNTSRRDNVISDRGFNTTLAQDALAVLQHAVRPLGNMELSDMAIRNSITDTISKVCYSFVIREIQN